MPERLIQIIRQRTRPVAFLALVLSTVLAGCAGRSGGPTTTSLVVRNNYHFAYEGPVAFPTTMPDGKYEGEIGTARVSGGKAVAVVSIPASSELALHPVDTEPVKPSGEALSVTVEGETLVIMWNGKEVSRLSFGLMVREGMSASVDNVLPSYQPDAVTWSKDADGSLVGRIDASGLRADISLIPFGGGWIDVETTVARNGEEAPEKAYIAVVRKVEAPALRDAQLRWNGRLVNDANSPMYWERDFWYTRGLDWAAWRSGDLAFVAVNGFAPSFSIATSDSNWTRNASHFYVWERSRQKDEAMYLISEVAGPNPDQEKSRYMPVVPYAVPTPDDTLHLSWRLAIDENPAEGWEESQLHVFAGYRTVSKEGAAEVVDLGVPYTSFGTSYFPYSTFAENFDYYRTTGLDRETWWPFSPDLWEQWRTFIPRMEEDLHIIHAMGFEWVRLHHLELLQQMDREEALAFLDFFMHACERLGFKVLIDSEGPEEWMALIAGRYRHIINRIEIENEIVIGGIRPGYPERWTKLYHAAKKAAPESDVFFTSAGNQGMFEKMRQLGVPFDRVGLHAYKHGPEGLETYRSHGLGVAGHATRLGKPMTLGEFNWKSYTRMSPEERSALFFDTYDMMLEPRAVPELFQFHWQETMCVSPTLSRSAIRHYETINLDRRPKPEAFQMMRIIRKYGRKDAPIVLFNVEIPEVQFQSGHAEATFTITNNSGREQRLHLRPVTFRDVESRLLTEEKVTLAPGATVEGHVALDLASDAKPGTYHHFLTVEYDDGYVTGWGVAANYGKPQFDAPVLDSGADLYPQGSEIVEQIAWGNPLTVAFGRDASGLEIEMAYMLRNTLQSATGRPVLLTPADAVPQKNRQTGTLILVGTPEKNQLIPSGMAGSDTGVVWLESTAGGQMLVFTGKTSAEVQAAATDFMQRFWPNARDAVLPVAGMEPGNLMGNRAGVTNPDPP